MKQTPKSLFPYYAKVDLSYREEWREYIFPNGERIRIDSPYYLIVSDNGHRIRDLNGFAHYVPYGWIHLIFKPKEGYGFYCERSDEIDPPEDEDLGYSIPPVNIDEIEKREALRDRERSDPPEKIVVLDPVREKECLEIVQDYNNATVSDLVSAFLRYLESQVDNADRLGSTTEAQTLDRVGEKFSNLFQSWMMEEEEDEPEEEPEQSSTEKEE